MVVLVSFVSLEEEEFCDVFVQKSLQDLNVKHPLMLNDILGMCLYLHFRIHISFYNYIIQGFEADNRLNCIEYSSSNETAF